MTKTKLRILFFSPKYYPEIGGVETHLEHINRLLQKDYVITVITESNNQKLPAHEHVNGVEVWRIPLQQNQNISAKKWQIWWWLVRHFHLLLTADIIHIHDVFYWILPFYSLISWKPIYTTFHGYEAPGPLTRKQIFWHQLAAWLSWGSICIGDFHRKWYHAKHNFVSYGGVDEISSTKKARSNQAIFVGRLADDTGIREYLHALAFFKKPFHCDIYGDGSLKKECEKFVQQHKLDVQFHGMVPNATAFFPAYTIIFASQYLSILQALAAGCAVIALADTPIKNDYLRMTPFEEFITIAESPKEIASAIENFHKPSANAVKWAQQQTWEKVAALYQKLWEREEV